MPLAWWLLKIDHIGGKLIRSAVTFCVGSLSEHPLFPGWVLPAVPEIRGSAVHAYVGDVLFSAAVAGRSELCLRFVLT
jgi:hypothetical protein